jgi:transcriptional regulator with XRE-family HTH domain
MRTLFACFFFIIQLMQRKNVIGHRVRQARKELKITQLELAAQLQVLGITVDRSGIAKLESGRRPVSDIEVVALCKVLNVALTWLFEGSDEIFGGLNA